MLPEVEFVNELPSRQYGRGKGNLTPAQIAWNERQKEYWGTINPWQDRFWARVDKTEGCWYWTGPLDEDGYGVSSKGARSEKKVMSRAHRIAFELVRGPIPKGLVLDHLCEVRHCVNPYDLEPVTAGQNWRRSRNYKTFNGRSTCFKGHSLDNCYYKSDGRKICKICMQIARLRRLGREDEIATIERTA